MLKPAGRGVILTDAGTAAMCQADQIFELGDRLPAAVQEVGSSPAVRLAVGISDALPKLAVHRLMKRVLQTRNLRLRCHEGEFEPLLSELALRKLDVVLADQAAPANGNLKLYSHSLGSYQFAWYAPQSLRATAEQGFPRSLAKVPILLPTTHAAVRTALDQWFERRAIQPHLVGEFEDSALLQIFGAGGMGVFPAAELVHDDLMVRYNVKRVGACDGVEQHLFAIGAEKKVMHPLVTQLLGQLTQRRRTQTLRHE